MGFFIRRVVPGEAGAAADLAAVYRLVCELAEYEKLPMKVDEAGFVAGFEGAIHVGCALAVEVSGGVETPVGYMVWYPTFSTFRGQSRVFLEDLYVRPESRGRGYGKAMLGALAGETRRLGCGVMHWQVLGWNEPAIGFYRSLGAEVDATWLDCRCEGESLERLASGEGARLLAGGEAGESA